MAEYHESLIQADQWPEEIFKLRINCVFVWFQALRVKTAPVKLEKHPGQQCFIGCCVCPKTYLVNGIVHFVLQDGLCSGETEGRRHILFFISKTVQPNLQLSIKKKSSSIHTFLFTLTCLYFLKKPHLNLLDFHHTYIFNIGINGALQRKASVKISVVWMNCWLRYNVWSRLQNGKMKLRKKQKWAPRVLPGRLPAHTACPSGPSSPSPPAV